MKKIRLPLIALAIGGLALFLVAPRALRLTLGEIDKYKARQNVIGSSGDPVQEPLTVVITGP